MARGRKKSNQGAPSTGSANPTSNGKAEVLDPSTVRDRSEKDIVFWSLLTQRMKDDQTMVERSTSWDRKENDGTDTYEAFTNDAPVYVNKFASMMCRHDARTSMPIPAGASSLVKDAVQLVEDLARFMWEEFSRRHAQGFGNNLKYDMWYFLGLRGMIAGRILRNPNQDQFFWDFLLADPMTVFPRYAGKKLLRVSHVYYETAAEVKGEFFDPADPSSQPIPDWLDGMTDDITLRIYAYYDQYNMMVTCPQAGDTWIKEPTPHGLTDEDGMPVVPWVIRTGRGAPYRSTEFDQTQWVPQVAAGILQYVRDQIGNKEKLLGMLYEAMEKETEPPAFVFTNAQGEVDVDTRSGGRNFFLATDKVELQKIGANVADMAQVGQIVQTMISRGAIDDILFGQGDPNLSGLSASAKSGNAKDFLAPFIETMKDFLHTVTRYALLYFSHFGAEVSIVHTDRTSGAKQSGVVVTHDMVTQTGTFVDFDYRNFTPQDLVAMGNLAALLVREGLVGLETARDRYLDIDDPTRENTLVLSDQAYKQPEVIKLASTLAVLGLIEGKDFTLDDLAMVVQKVSALAGGPPPGAGGPPSPVGPPPGIVPPNAGQAGSGMAPPPGPPTLDSSVLPPQLQAALAGLSGNAGSNIGPPPSLGPNPTGQNLQAAPLP